MSALSKIMGVAFFIVVMICFGQANKIEKISNKMEEQKKLIESYTTVIRAKDDQIGRMKKAEKKAAKVKIDMEKKRASDLKEMSGEEYYKDWSGVSLPESVIRVHGGSGGNEKM